MKLEKGLANFLKEAIEEKSICTVEGSYHRMITEEETIYLNNELNPYGYSVNCFECETCSEYSNGTERFHLERVNNKYK